MRRFLVASLFLSTVLLNAQEVTKGQGATLVAHNEATNSAATDVPTATTARRISTGVISPKLISEPSLKIATADFTSVDLSAQHMVVAFRVDQNGTPQNVHLLKSVNPTVDSKVLAAVRGYRYAPATLDEVAVPMDVNLEVSFATR